MLQPTSQTFCFLVLLNRNTFILPSFYHFFLVQCECDLCYSSSNVKWFLVVNVICTAMNNCHMGAFGYINKTHHKTCCTWSLQMLQLTDFEKFLLHTYGCLLRPTTIESLTIIIDEFVSCNTPFWLWCILNYPLFCYTVLQITHILFSCHTWVIFSAKLVNLPKGA